MKRLIALLPTLPLLAACTPHTTQATQVGVILREPESLERSVGKIRRIVDLRPR